jgi:ribosome biogenesis protein ENP2
MLKTTSGNDVAVYQVSGTNSSRALPDWMVRKRKKQLRDDEGK